MILQRIRIIVGDAGLEPGTVKVVFILAQQNVPAE